ncbi:MAG: hypothetical protein ACTHU0_28155 [Kofleriaceae bacterium]
MDSKLRWTLATVAILGGSAHAEPEREVPSQASHADVIRLGSSPRGVAQDYLVLPAGGEISASMRFVTSEPSLGGEPLRFSDLALFGLAGRWSLARWLEASASVDLLPKQPSFTDEKPWQSVGFGLRGALGKRAAVAVTGAGGHLLGSTGLWTRESLSVQWRKPITPVMTFDVVGGVQGVGLWKRDVSNAVLGEVWAASSALFREPTGHWGAWVGIGYAVPVFSRGEDPTTGLEIDPQPRLDFRIGTVLSLVREWDLFAELAVIDRGDLSDPATRLPILDGGFDQRQVIFGITRHLERKSRRNPDDAMVIGAR